MAHIRIPPGWKIPESLATPDEVYWNRRRFLRASAAALAGGVLLPSIGCEAGEDPIGRWRKQKLDAKRNEGYELNRGLTDEVVAGSYNNFYEFTTAKDRVWRLARELTLKPWSVEVAGLAKRTGKFDVEELLKKLPIEERLYRFRCVETWAMAVPWTGIPMKAFLDWVEPQAKAKYVRFLTFHRPKEAPNQRPGTTYAPHFPYYEGLSMEEAANELTLLVVGIYGHRLPPQHGAPIRVIVPWKYGYKSAKSVVRIEFVEKQPRTFWNDLAPREYGFVSNVNPDVPHPRWSQKFEWMIPDRDERRPTLLYNGYADQVAHLYS